MKTQTFLASATLAIMLGGPALSMAGNDGKLSSPQTTLSQVEVEDILLMREEEKLARDVYITLYAQWGTPVFANISRAERRHMSRMLRLIDNYGLTDPVTDDSVGVFVNPELQVLYDTLVARGLSTELDALFVGALIEEVDIEDLQAAIDRTTHLDTKRVYENLMRGSRNHLRAFVRNIERQGISYEAQEIDQDAVDLILSEPIERGGRGGSHRR